MKKSACFAAAAALVMGAASLAALDLESVKEKVKSVAAVAGADVSVLDKGLPNAEAVRGQKGTSAVGVNAVLEAAEAVAGKAGKDVHCSLDACPHAGSVAVARLTLAEIRARLEKGGKDRSLSALAADLHHAAASIRKARVEGQSLSDRPFSAVRSKKATSEDQAKLELALELAETAEAYLKASR